jgi:hypothetical protein
MRLFVAGLYTSNFSKTGSIYQRLTDGERVARDSVENCLESYHYINRPSFVDRIARDGVRVFLDSGAFSSYTKGVSVNVSEYCAYIHRNAEIIEEASVLDAIGDFRGTFANQQEMERQGTRPLPCFHYGEPEEVLDWYVARYPYITIGGMVPISTPQLKLWLDRLWEEHLTHPDGTPKLRVHGFGLTSLPLMMRYPWYSVDSSTWVQWAANGMILVPGIGQINVSEYSSSRKKAKQHLDTLSPVERDYLEGQIRRHGFEPDRLRKEYISRWAWNCWAFPYWAKLKQWEGDRFVPEVKRLF